MFKRGDWVVNVITGVAGKVFERFGPSTNPRYRDYLVHFTNRTGKVVKERHLRKAMPGEVRHYTTPSPAPTSAPHP